MFSGMQHVGDHASHGVSLVADAVVGAVAVGTVSMSLIDELDIGIKITIGVLTIVLLILRIRAHVRGGSAAQAEE